MTLDSSRKKADLHIHTCYSDGLLSPTEVTEHAKKRGLQTIAITDHDSILGVEEARTSGGRELEVIPGVELSTIYQDVDVHILGYYVDFRNGKLISYLVDLQRFREQRARQMIEKLAGYGIRIEYDRVRDIAQQGALGRPHIATAMQEKGYVATIDEAFYRFIGYHGPCYVPKKEIEPREAIATIKEFGGLAVLAHPGVYGCDELTAQILKDGIDGVEVWHPEHSKTCVERLLRLAKEGGLLITGGSDCHGGRKGRSVLIGQVFIDECYVNALRQRAGAV